MTTTDTTARAAPRTSLTHGVRKAVRTLAVQLTAALVRATVIGWRYLVTVYALARLGLVWRTFCANTGLAVERPTAVEIRYVLLGREVSGVQSRRSYSRATEGGVSI